MARWSIGRVRTVAPAPDSDCYAAYALHFAENDQPEPNITIEYAAGGSRRYGSPAHARAAAEAYLDDEQPPRRLVVDREGKARPRAN